MNKSKFYDLLAQSVIVQGLITLMVVGTICYLYITLNPVPAELLGIAMLILGFYFGGKTQLQAQRLGKRNENDIHYSSN